MIKLLATDMDGTFLNKKGQYDAARLRNLLDEMNKKGMKFAAASGRSLLSLKREFQGFEDDVIFLGENGGVVMYQDRVLYEELMPKETYLNIVQKIIDSHFKNTTTVHLSGKHAAYALTSMSDEYRTFLEKYYPVLITVDDFSQVEDDIYKVGANFAPSELHQASQWLTDTIPGVVSLTSGFECLDVMLEHVDKGNAMMHMCESLGISLDEVIAFGDNFNDAQMLKTVGRAVVPANAQEAIQALADEVIEDHDSQSVIRYMEMVTQQAEE